MSYQADTHMQYSQAKHHTSGISQTTSSDVQYYLPAFLTYTYMTFQNPNHPTHIASNNDITLTCQHRSTQTATQLL